MGVRVVTYDPFTARCCRCDEMISNLDDCYYSVKGFCRKREAGGANTVYLKRETGYYMCNRCMGLELEGLHPGQGALLDA
jgi:hypothetical protein